MNKCLLILFLLISVNADDHVQTRNGTGTMLLYLQGEVVDQTVQARYASMVWSQQEKKASLIAGNQFLGMGFEIVGTSETNPSFGIYTGGRVSGGLSTPGALPVTTPTTLAWRVNYDKTIDHLKPTRVNNSVEIGNDPLHSPMGHYLEKPPVEKAFRGPWGGDRPTAEVRLSRIGQMVTLSLDPLLHLATEPNYINCTFDQLDTPFIPRGVSRFSVPVIDNGQYTAGILAIDANDHFGRLHLSTADNGYFSGAGMTGWPGLEIRFTGNEFSID